MLFATKPNDPPLSLRIITILSHQSQSTSFINTNTYTHLIPLMGRQGNETSVLHSSSSIALLQERFRQLQRVKEMREEREQQRVFADGERSSTGAHCEQPKWFFHPELIRPSRPLHGPSSLGISVNGDRAELPLIGNNCNDTDVDTSLHL